MLPAETVHHIFNHRDSLQSRVHAGTTVREKWLPTETVCMMVLPAESLGRKHSHTDRLYRKPFISEQKSLQETGNKRSGGAKSDGQAQQEAKISGLIYTL